jgi:hypothetical protein
MSRHPIGEQAMSSAERQARYRAARAAGVPAVHTRRAADHRSRAKQWCDSVARLLDLQGYYAGWLERLPDNLHDSATGLALQAVVELDLETLAAIDPPRGFGRD